MSFLPNHNRRLLTSILGAIVIHVTSVFASEPQAANAQWMQAYEILEKATEAEKQDNPTRALELYNAARQNFSSVQRQHPRWNPALVSYRISFTLKQIQRLQQHLQDTSRSLTSAEMAAVTAAQNEKIRTLQQANEDLQHRLDLTTKALSRAREEAARSLLTASEAATLVKEKKVLEKQLRTREEDLKQLTTQLVNWKNTRQKTNSQTQDLRQERDLALAQQVEAEAKTQKYMNQCERLKQQLRLANDEIAKLEQNSKNELSAALTDLNRRNVTARQNLDQQYREQVAELENSLNTLKANQIHLEERIRNQVKLIRQQEKQIASKGEIDRDLLLRERDAEIARLRNAIVVEKAKNYQNDAKQYLQQIQNLKSQLANERTRTCALEKAIQQNLSQNPSPAPVSTEFKNDTEVFAKTEQQRRHKEASIKAKTYLRNGLTAEEKGNIEAAIWNYRQVLDLRDTNKVALQRLGLIAAEQGNEQQAEGYLNRAFKLDPDDITTLTALGFCLTRQRQVYPAIAMLTRAVALAPESADTHRALGVACSSLGWHDAAEVQFRQAYDLNQQDSETAYNLAILLASRGQDRMTEAREWYIKAKKLSNTFDPGLDRFFGIEN